MEKTLSNDIFRIFIINSILNNNVCDISLDEGTYLYFVAQKLEKMNESGNDAFVSLYNGVITTAYLDAFKILNAKQRDSSIDFEEKKLYDLLASFDCFECLENALFSNFYLLEELLKYSLEFYRYNTLKKISTMKKLSDVQKNSLKDNFELFKNDLDEYDFKEKFPLEVLTDYYNEEIQKCENSSGIIDIGAASEDLIEEIIGFLKTMVGNDNATFEEIMEDIILLDYKWSKFIVDNKLIIDTVNIDDCYKKIELFENNNITILIAEEVLYVDYYFYILIESLILIKCKKLYIDENIINEEIVDEYYDKIQRKNLNK